MSPKMAIGEVISLQTLVPANISFEDGGGKMEHMAQMKFVGRETSGEASAVVIAASNVG